MAIAAAAVITSECAPVPAPRTDVPPIVVHVVADRAWRDTGIPVQEGELLYFTATGEITWQARRTTSGPDGINGSPGWLRAGGLIGKVSTTTFEIGARTQPIPDKNPRSRVRHPPPPIRMPASGTLVLGFKDFSSGANTGGFDVTVHRTR
jgi:hypothetical protein